ncbi:MAG TPA: DUF2129 domain-containing protein [Pseudogracilibacillus sp.]|nr:DUF2129 domain-containing protein [Pseudogracilibacillus sp.]
MRVKRQGLIVWFQHKRNIKQIKRFGHLIYVSKRMRYAVIYVNQDEVEEIEKSMAKLSYIIKVERSYKPFVTMNYENAVPDKAKIYDYKMGI